MHNKLVILFFNLLTICHFFDSINTLKNLDKNSFEHFNYAIYTKLLSVDKSDIKIEKKNLKENSNKIEEKNSINSSYNKTNLSEYDSNNYFQELNKFTSKKSLSVSGNEFLNLVFKNNSHKNVSNDTFILKENNSSKAKFLTHTGHRSIRSSNNSKLGELIRSSPCASNKDCSLSKSCDTQQGLCKCPNGYISAKDLKAQLNSESSNWSPNHCYLAMSLEKNCSYDEQCIVKHSKCTRDENLGQHLHCACSHGYTSKDHQDLLKFGSFTMKVNKICHEKPAQARLSFIVIITMCTIILAISSIGCILLLFRLRKRKQRPFTMTTLVGNNQNLAMNPNLGHGGNVLNNGNQGYLTNTNNSVMNAQVSNNMLLSNQHMSNLTNVHGQPMSNQMMMMMQPHPQQQQHPAFRMAPMGSAEAEFQNDFIAVFPMHHLEPCPEKNTTAALMNLEKSYMNN